MRPNHLTLPRGKGGSEDTVENTTESYNYYESLFCLIEVNLSTGLDQARPGKSGGALTYRRPSNRILSIIRFEDDDDGPCGLMRVCSGGLVNKDHGAHLCLCRFMTRKVRQDQR